MWITTAILLWAFLCTSPTAAHAGVNAWTSNGPGGGAVNAIAIDPVTPSTLYAAGSDVFKSTDSGGSWSATGLDAPTTLAIDPHAPSTLYASTFSGVFKSTDGAVSWNATHIPPSGGVNTLAIDAHTPSTLYAATDVGSAGTTPSGVFASTDSGVSWSSASSGLPGNVSFTSLAIDPSDSRTLYVGTAGTMDSQYVAAGLFKSTDAGASWTSRSAGLPQSAIHAVVIDPRAPQTLYAAMVEDQLFKSTDAGVSWSVVPVSAYGSMNYVFFVSALAVDPRHSTTLYAAVTLHQSAGNVLVESTDGGQTWDQQRGNPGNQAFGALVVDPHSAILYAGSYDGEVYTQVLAPQPATFTVDSTDDASDANPNDGVCATAAGTCTLRAAVESARDGDLIFLPSGTYILTLGRSLDIQVALTLRGAAAATTRIDGGGESGVINIGNTTVVISDVSIQNGGGNYGDAGIKNNGDTQLTNVVVSGNNQQGVYGGGIYNFGRLLVANSTISDNSLSDSGGPAFGAGLSNDGEATLMNVTLSGNTADGRESAGGRGGALFNAERATLTLSHVTVSENAANSAAGGIENEGTLTVTDSTLSGNRSGGFGGYGGGGLYNRGSATLANATISGNTAVNAGGGLYNTGGATLTNVTLTDNAATAALLGQAQGGGIFGGAVLRNTIVANNISIDPAGTVRINCSGRITDGGHNLDDGTSCGFTSANGSLSNTNPQLDPAGLQDNGGPTFTQALLPGSPAIDAGGADCPPTDQRGVSRPHGAACDIGAYEFVPVACAGDCGGTGGVMVNDVLTLVNIALGNADLLTCVRGVPSGTQVTVVLIIQAVNNALNGCGS